MIVLAVDTALAACSVALHDSTTARSLAERTEPMTKGHAERLAGMTGEVMRDGGHGFDGIDRIAVTIGPGTFTGVRIGLAFARGLALAIGKHVVGITTLEALAAAAAPQAAGRPIAAAIDARRGEIYLQAFSPSLDPLAPAATVAVAEASRQLPAGRVLLAGSGARLIGDCGGRCELPASGELPQPAIIARLAAGRAEPQAPPAPLYLRRPDAKPQAPLIALPPADIHIATAGAQHAEVLAAIHAECFARPWSAQDFASLVATPGTAAWIASDAAGAHVPLGLIVTRKAADEAEILTIATRPNARRRAVARRLLAVARETLSTASCIDLHLEVDEDNATARAFYRAAGFSETGRRTDYYRHDGGHASDAILMHRKL